MKFTIILIISIFFISSSHAYDENLKLNRTNVTEFSGEENIKVTRNGMQDFKNRCKELSENYGERFSCPKLIDEMINNGETF